MPTLCFCATPKPFDGEYARLQQTALRSWTLLRPRTQMMLLGDEPGVHDAAIEFGARHVPEVERNVCHTPLLDSLFRLSTDLARTDLVAYVNADIVLMSDFMAAVLAVASRFPRFLMIGERRNLRPEPIDFDEAWEARLRARAIREGKFYTGIDYFVFPRTLWGTVPPFALGRFHWDNWPIYAARLRRAVVVDATPVVVAVHQDHSYAPGQIRGDEIGRNFALLGGARNEFTTRDATHVLTPEGLKMRCRSCYPACVCSLDWE